MLQTTRRRFLATGSRTAMGMSLLPLASYSVPEPTVVTAGDGLLAAAIKDVETQVPSLVQAIRTPGLSIAVLTNGRIAWTRGFGVARSLTPYP
jgi:hypothetical protein